jgi:hypothetical protein
VDEHVYRPAWYPHQESSLGRLRVKEVRFRYAMGAWSLEQVPTL